MDNTTFGHVRISLSISTPFFQSQLLRLLSDLFSPVPIFKSASCLPSPFSLSSPRDNYLIRKWTDSFVVNTFKDAQRLEWPETQKAIWSLPIIFVTCSHCWEPRFINIRDLLSTRLWWILKLCLNNIPGLPALSAVV